MTIAVAGNRSVVGVAIAEINLKFIWDVISGIKVGRTGDAFVLDRPGRLVAHPDISLVLRADEAGQRPFHALRAAILARPGEAETGRDIAGDTVLAAMAQIPGVDWSVIVKQPLAEAFGPLYTALWRTAALLVGGAALAALLAWWLAQRAIGPIRLLEDGVTRIGAGQFDHRIELATGDEFERLATRFNEMAVELSLSQERSQRISRLKRFLAPQVAELVDRTGDDRVLDGRRVEVVVMFCDLRGFTAFSARADTETVIGVLRAYYDVLERVVNAHEATLINFFGDGAMVLLNAPVACPDPALRAVAMARDMQIGVQELLAGWRALENRLGFGIGLAMGPATVGRIGSEGRLDYTAVGNVVNLASRLCDSAVDNQILVDRAAALAIGSRVPLVLSLLKTRKRRASVAFRVPRPYRRGHDHTSVRGRFPALVPAAQPRLVGTRARCSATPGDRPASATPWPASALLHRPLALGVALPNLAAGPQHHGAGQTGNRRPVASQRLPSLLAAAITPSGAAQDEPRDP